MDDIRNRHPMFRMPTWMSDDDGMSELASRMSNAPHWSSIHRSAPWREHRNSGGSAMSATSEDDSYETPPNDKSSQSSGGSAGSDAHSHEIPIMIEAEAPPSMMQQQVPDRSKEQQQETRQQECQQDGSVPGQPHMAPFGQVRKAPQYATHSSGLDGNSGQSRVTRCASAPPEMAEQPGGNRYVSRISITPQTRSATTPIETLNSSPRPFVSSFKPQNQQKPNEPIIEESSNQPEQSWQQSSQQYQPQQFTTQQQNYQQQQPSQFQRQQQHPFSYGQRYYPNQNQEDQHPHFTEREEHNTTPPRAGVVRNIPIFLEDQTDGTREGRSTPLSSSPQAQSQQQAQQFSQHGPQMKHPQQQTYRQPPQEQLPPQPAPPPPPKEPRPSQSPPQQPQVQPPILSPLEKIQAVRESLGEFHQKVEEFQGTKRDRDFLYLDETLTRALLKLDNIDPDGQDDVRQARRNLIREINDTISKLEKKAIATPVVEATISFSDNKTPDKGLESSESTQKIETNEAMDTSQACERNNSTSTVQTVESNSEIDNTESTQPPSTGDMQQTAIPLPEPGNQTAIPLPHSNQQDTIPLPNKEAAIPLPASAEQSSSSNKKRASASPVQNDSSCSTQVS